MEEEAQRGEVLPEITQQTGCQGRQVEWGVPQ